MTLLAKFWDFTLLFFVLFFVFFFVALLLLTALPFLLIRDSWERFRGKPDGIILSTGWQLIRERPDEEYWQGCICDYEAILPELSEILGAQYGPGEYDAAEAAFTRAVFEKMQKKKFTITIDNESELWFLTGDQGRLVVDFQYGDGYFFCLLQAKGDVLVRAARLIHDEALREGANPRTLRALPEPKLG